MHRINSPQPTLSSLPWFIRSSWPFGMKDLHKIRQKQNGTVLCGLAGPDHGFYSFLSISPRRLAWFPPQKTCQRDMLGNWPREKSSNCFAFNQTTGRLTVCPQAEPPLVRLWAHPSCLWPKFHLLWWSFFHRDSVQGMVLSWFPTHLPLSKWTWGSLSPILRSWMILLKGPSWPLFPQAANHVAHFSLASPLIFTPLPAVI